MIRNYFKIAIRHLTRHKLFSLINICCLAIGITFTMLIVFYVIAERNVNANLSNVQNQYIIRSKWKVKDMGLEVTTLGPLAKALKETYPNLVANYYRANTITNVVSAGDNHFVEQMSIGDTSLVSMYGFKLLYGNPTAAFKDQRSAVITETVAQKLFGRKDVINKTISVTTTTGARQDFLVSAVLKDPGNNSVTSYLGFNYNVYMPFEGNMYFKAGGNGEDNWANSYIIGMIELKPGVTPRDMKAPVEKLLALHAPETIKNNLQVEFLPMKTFYLDDKKGAVRKMTDVLSMIAVFILIMAIINFINISIGTSSYRVKEIGLRKLFGSNRSALVFQHITESVLLTCISLLLSFLLYELLRPLFNGVLDTRVTPLLQFGVFQFSLLFLFAFGIGIIAGIYPAFVLSAGNMVSSVKGKINTATGGLLLRKSLLVLQFSIAITVFVCALNVSKQVSYVFNKDLGYNKDQVLVITAFPKQWDSAGVYRMENIRNGLMQLPAVKTASVSFDVPEWKPNNAIDLLPEGETGAPMQVRTISADENYAVTFGLQVKEGHFLDNKNTSLRQNEIVLNEAAVKAFGWKSVIGKRVKWVSAGLTLDVAGVVKDYNYASVQEGIDPVVFLHVKDLKTYRLLSVKLNTSDMAAALKAVEKKWKELSPNSPFEYVFMDDKFQGLYRSDLQLRKASNIATALNLVIVFMGIFGVVAFTLTKRTKEIAVRKVLGAEVFTIILLFIKEYALLIFIANCIAWPLAYLISNQWLENYTYRIQQNLVPFVIVGAFTFIMAFVLIGIQCFKAAVVNPVKSLRSE